MANTPKKRQSKSHVEQSEAQDLDHQKGFEEAPQPELTGTPLPGDVSEWAKEVESEAKKPVKNKDLWVRLDEATQTHQIQWNWIKGHSGHEGNERADALANKAMDEKQGNV